MRFSSFATVFFLLFTIAISLFVFSSSAATAQEQGYVTYQVTLKHEIGNSVNQTSFTVKESSQPADENGFVVLSLGLTSSLQNFSYSRLVNASSLPEIFPLVPTTANQSFSYKTHGILITGNFSNVGTAPITFNGSNYQASNYSLALSVSNATMGKNLTVVGSALAFPSSLLYSIEIQNPNGSASVYVKLLATDLPLSYSPSGVSKVEGTALVSVGIFGAAAVVIPWRLKGRKNSQTKSKDSEKPSYWVD